MDNNNIVSQVIFGHLESTIAVRCLARNDMGVVAREVKLVSNGKMLDNLFILGPTITLNNGFCQQVSLRHSFTSFSLTVIPELTV